MVTASAGALILSEAGGKLTSNEHCDCRMSDYMYVNVTCLYTAEHCDEHCSIHEGLPYFLTCAVGGMAACETAGNPLPSCP